MGFGMNYVGLSQQALDFLTLNSAQKVGSMEITQGIAGESLYGSLYLVRDKLYTESVDTEVWRSGYILFTKLVGEEDTDVVGAWTISTIEEMILNYV